MTTEARYLLAIFIAEKQGSMPVTFETIADRLDRSPATVTEMCQRLADRGLVAYRPYNGVLLTEDGRDTAATLHESYVTMSWFFRDVLELSDPEEEAMAVVGAVSPSVTERLAAMLLGDDDPQPTPKSGDRD
jgi:DtxR family Mn-dependent transcriptional regulator